MKNKELQYYLDINYPVELVQQEAGWYFVRIPDLPGCMSEGSTAEEAMANIAEAKKLWLEGAVESGYDIPLPSSQRKYSGKFLVRLPASLHERLAEAAEREGVSLNQYICSLLSERNAGTGLLNEIDSMCARMNRLLNYSWSIKTEPPAVRKEVTSEGMVA